MNEKIHAKNPGRIKYHSPLRISIHPGPDRWVKKLRERIVEKNLHRILDTTEYCGNLLKSEASE